MRKYPSLYILVFLLAGILLADLSRWSALNFVIAGSISAILIWVASYFHKNKLAVVMIGVAIAFGAAGNFAIQTYDHGSNHIVNHFDDNKSYRIYGEIGDWPKLKKERTELIIEVDSLGGEEMVSVQGRILLNLSDTSMFLQLGDRVEFVGRIYSIKSRNSPGGFDYARYLSMKSVFGIVYLPTLLDIRIDKTNRYGLTNISDQIRNWITVSLYNNLSAESAALSAGFLIGDTRGISKELYDRFRDSGTLHLLAVSGSNVAMVVLFFILLLRPWKIHRKIRSLLLLVVLLFFTMLSYGEPSVTRASVMAAIIILAQMVERRYDLNNVIAATAVIILLFDPAQFFDVGFQLSFVTAWGLIFAVPLVNNRFEKHHNRAWYRWLFVPVIVSLVAQLYSSPLIASYFGKVPLLSVPANLLIVPLVSLVVMGILLLLMVTFILPLLGALVGAIVDPLIKLLVWLLDLFGGEGAVVADTSSFNIIMAASVLLVISLFMAGIGNLRFRRIAILLSSSMLVLVFSVSILGDLIKEEVPVDLFVDNLPGGIAVLIKDNSNKTGTLVVTGLKGKSYQIDELIIQPIIDYAELTRVNRFVVLNCSYDGIDDLLRFAKKNRLDSIIVSRNIYHAFVDQKNRQFSLESLKIISCNNTTIEQFTNHTAGLLVDKKFCYAKIGAVSIIVSTQNIDLLDSTQYDNSHIIVLDNSNISKIDQNSLSGLTKSRALICSEFAQDVEFDHTNTPSISLKAGSQLLWPVKKLGFIQLRIPELPQKSMPEEQNL